MFGFGYLLKNCERRRGGQPNVDRCGERCGGQKSLKMCGHPSWMPPLPPNDLKFKWKQQDSNHLVCQRALNHSTLSQTGKMTEPWCEYFTVRCIWLYVIIMLRTRFRVNPHSNVAWMSRTSKLAKWLSCVASTYLYGELDCMLLCHVRLLECLKCSK